MTPWRLCGEHGVLDASAIKCPHCGVATLDGTDAAQRDLVTAAFAAHPIDMRRVGMAWGAIFLLIVLGIYIYEKSERIGTFVGYGLVVAAIAILAWASRMPIAWRVPPEPGARLRLWTSAPVISVMLCFVFVVIREVVGVQALWYGAGLPLWRIATATLTHGGFMHLVGNMLFTWLFGVRVDLRVGRAWTTVIIAASAIVAALAQAQYSAHPMVGFSGAVYGLLGATLALLPTSPQVLRISAASFVVPTWAWMLVVIPAFTLVSAFDTRTNVAWVAHLAGFLGGILVALPMRRVRPSERFLLLEKLRLDRITSKRKDYINVTADELAADTTDVASSNPEIAAFHAAARRRRAIVSLVGGIAMLVFGGIATTVATLTEAPPDQAGRRTSIIIAGLVMCLTGAVMLLQAVNEARARKKAR